MVARWPGAFLLSSILHGSIVAAIVLLCWAVVERDPPSKIMTFVDGIAPAAQALAGSAAPTLRVTLPSSPPRAVPAPMVAMPVETASPTMASPRTSSVPARATVTHALPRTVATASTGRRMTKSEFDARQGSQRAPSSTTVSRARRPYVDGTSIAGELKAEADASKRGDGSAGASIGPDSYVGRLEAALGAAIERHPGLLDGLSAVAEYRIRSDGRLMRVRLVAPSGDAEFDRVLIETIAGFLADPRPADVPELHRTTFHTRAR